ncbi:MAG: sulfite exporter TauE/SafE family protein [Acidimicrobiia bacterium]|nr:sulfite exporter TauE/SafE family protein [Acidimicrobiia bacterium]
MTQALTKPIALGAVAGTIAGLFGVGGGVIVVPGLVLWLAVSQREASGTSTATIVASSAAAMVAFGIGGDIDWHAAGLILIGSVVGAWGGAWIAERINERALAVTFAVVLAVAGIRMVI